MSGSSDYTQTPNLRLFKPTYDADEDQWGLHWNQNADTLDSTIAALVVAGPTPPPLPRVGALWWNSTDGNTYIWFNDGTSTQWVPAMFSGGIPLVPGGGPYLPLAGGTVSGGLNWTATGATASRAAQDRSVEQISVKDFGATGTADDTATFAAALAAIAAGGRLFIPAGTYNIGSALAQTITASATIEGAGSGVTTLRFFNTTDGLSLSYAAPQNLHIRGLSIVRAATGAVYSNTGLSVIATSFPGGGNVNGPITIQDVTVRGNIGRTTAWMTGIGLNAPSSIALDHVMVLMPNATGANVGVGIAYAGQSGSFYAVEAALSDVTVQGGGQGLAIGDWVQGVYVSNSRFLGLDYGVYWPGVGTHSDIWLAVTNTHFNAGSRGLYAFGVGGVICSNTDTLHFAVPSVTGDWSGFEIHNSNTGMVTNSNVVGNGSSFSGTENAVQFISGNLCTAVGNVFSTIRNDAVVLSGTQSQSTVASNVGANIGGALVNDTSSGSASNARLLNTLNSVPDLTMNAAGTLVLSHGVALNDPTAPLLTYSANGTGPPTFTTRSTGTKLVLYPALGATAVDYGIGVAANQVWMSVPQANSASVFSWYGGTTQLATFDGTGILRVTSTGANPIQVTAPSTQNCQDSYTVAGVRSWYSGPRSNGTFYITDANGPADCISFSPGGGTTIPTGSLVISTAGAHISIGANQVVAGRIAGWGTSSGGARGAITASSTLAQVAAGLSQLLTDLQTHGLIGV